MFNNITLAEQLRNLFLWIHNIFKFCSNRYQPMYLTTSKYRYINFNQSIGMFYLFSYRQLQLKFYRRKKNRKYDIQNVAPYFEHIKMSNSPYPCDLINVEQKQYKNAVEGGSGKEVEWDRVVQLWPANVTPGEFRWKS